MSWRSIRRGRTVTALMGKKIDERLVLDGLFNGTPLAIVTEQLATIRAELKQLAETSKAVATKTHRFHAAGSGADQKG